jgi:hypothetical protein
MGLVALLIGVAIGSAGSNDTDNSTVAADVPEVTKTATATVTETAPGASETVTEPASPPVTKRVTKTVTKTAPAPPPVTKTAPAPPPPPVTETVQSEAQSAIQGDGIYLVGTDIQPGTYRNSGGGDCYWARLRNLSGGLGSIIANGLGANQIVTISASDAAFESTRCGSWSRIS